MAPRMRRRITSAKREEIEKEQEALAKSIVRPFDVVAGLPVSYNTPPYGRYEDVLKNPLTVKDSAILYRSLMKSRSNYVNGGPMFKLYWLKQSNYIKRLWSENKPTKNDNERRPILGAEVNARDVMVKLCDSGLTLGPHTFEIRMFIAKDERSDKPSKDELLVKLESEKLDSELIPQPTVPESKDLELSQPAAAGSQSPQPNTLQSNSLKPSPSPAETGPQNAVPNTTEKSPSHETPKSTEKSPSVENSPTPNDSSIIEKNLTPNTTPSLPQTANEPTNLNPGLLFSPSVKPLGSLNGSGSGPDSGPGGASGMPASSPLNSSAFPSINKSPGYQRQSPPPSMLGRPVPPKKPRFDLDSPENAQTIKNLTTLARFDPNLEKLMEEIATGKAPRDKVAVFQGFTARAREMGPPPHPYLAPNFRMNPHIPFKLKNLLRDRKQSRPPKHLKERDQRLTAFQERYLTNANLLFEFVENPNVRFLFPKTAICEVLASKSSSDERDILISFLWIHNLNEVEAYEEKLKKYEDAIKERERKEKEEEEKKKAEEEKLKQEEDELQQQIEEGQKSPDAGDALPASSRTRRRPSAPPKKTKKPVNKAPKKLVPPEMPEIRFTPVSFQLHEIPVKFVPIVTNSFEPAEKVREYMKGVLDRGIRTSSLNLWYQVDGKLDEELAEDIRTELVQEERKMTGFVSASNVTKKRRI